MESRGSGSRKYEGREKENWGGGGSRENEGWMERAIGGFSSKGKEKKKKENEGVEVGEMKVHGEGYWGF